MFRVFPVALNAVLNRSIKYFGYVITLLGIMPNNEQVAAITQMNPPSCIKHASFFVQTCAWYWTCILDFVEIARPLTPLFKRSTVFRFGRDERNACTVVDLR